MIGATVLSYAAGWVIDRPAVLPVLNAAAAWWCMAREIRDGRMTRAVTLMLVWAAVMGAMATAMAAGGWSRGADDRALFLNGGYRDEMLHWVRTGEGAESHPAVFVPAHARNTAIFTAAAIGSGGMLAMPLGAVQMNFMGEYVGAMAAGSRSPWLSALLGWHPWAVARIAGFVILGVVLSGPVLARLMRFPFSLARYGGWIGLGVSLLILDAGLKATLAPAWGRLLRSVAGW